MSTNTASIPYGEVLRSIINTSEAAVAAAFRPRPLGFGRNAVQAAASVHEPAVLRRHPHLVRFADVQADLDLLIDRAIAAIVDGEPTEDEILGHYVNIASLEAAKSFLIDAFGGQVIYQSFGPQDRPRQGSEFERATGAFTGTVVRAQAMVKIGTGPDIELFEMHGPEQAQPVRASDFGITHFGVYTDDIDASVERFEKAGGTPLTAPRAIPYATEKGLGNKVCYCRMPWGTTMEFITTPDRMAYHDQTDLRRWQDEE